MGGASGQLDPGSGRIGCWHSEERRFSDGFATGTAGSHSPVPCLTLCGIGTAAPVAGFVRVMISSERAASGLVGGITRVRPRVLKATGILPLLAGPLPTAREMPGILP